MPQVQEPQAADKAINAWLLEDKLHIAPRGTWDKKPIQILKGDQVFNIRESSATKHTTNSTDTIFPLHNKNLVATIEGDQKIPLKYGINQLDNYIISGKKTLSLCLGNKAQPCQVNIARNLPIKSNKQDCLEVTGLLGVHRGNGIFVVEVEHKGVVTRCEQPFSQDHIGGNQPLKYQKLSIKLPPIAGKGFINLFIEHEGYVPWESSKSSNTFYFICDLRIAEHNGKVINCLQPRSLHNNQKLPEQQSTLRSNVIPFQSPNDPPLELEWSDGSRTALFKPLSARVNIAKIHDCAIAATTTNPGLYNIYINGSLAATEYIDIDETSIKINSKFLRGDACLIQIRDLSGSQVLGEEAKILKRALTPEEVLIRETKPPYPTDLTIRAGHRFESIRKHLSEPIAGTDSRMLSQALETLQKSYETLSLDYLDIPTQRNPKVSIIIPVHNKITATYYCLCSLLVAYNKTKFEVIVVDDGSTDETAHLEDIVSGIKVIHNSEPQRFIGACNIGAKNSEGEYIVLLNNDTEVTHGWLDELVQAFERFDNVGAVGSKLLYPDGTLQGAGGIVWGSGNPWNYGTGQNPWDPRFMYAREVDYICGAALMTPKKLWNELGGLSDYLKPMYFEDTDYSFKVREAGYKTYYIPSSIVYHHEGLTSGTDTSSGFKRFQEVNRPKFKKKWYREFQDHGKDGAFPDLEKDRGIVGRALFIDYTTPREDRDAGSYAAIKEIELVQSLGYKVTFLPKNLGFLGSYTQVLCDMGVEVITAPFYLSVEDFIAQRGSEFNCAYITRYYVAEQSIEPLRKYAPDCKIIMNNADLHFLRELRSAGTDSELIQHANEIKQKELNMMRLTDVVISYNETEHAVIQSHTDNAVRVMKCPWVVDIPKSQPQFSKSKGLAFLGSFKHPPNLEGVEWFASEVMPLLTDEISLSVYGASMDESLQSSLTERGINAVGYIEHLESLYTTHRIFIAPLLSGAGIKGKVINALAYGIPTVLTPVAAEGIGLRHGHDCLIARTAEEWAECIEKLYNDEALWKSISRTSRDYAQREFSFKEGRRLMKEIFESVELYKTHE